MYNCEHYTDTIYYQFEQTAKYCKYLGLQIFSKLNLPITTDEFATLDVIMVNEGICQRDLAKLILKDRPNTGRILNSLEEKGLIERFTDRKNNRLVRKMRLTQDGEKILENSSQVLRQYLDNLSKIFTDDDKRNLKNLMLKFRKSLEKEVEVNI